MFVCVYLCVFVYAFMCIYMFLCVCLCVHTVYLCMYVCVVRMCVYVCRPQVDVRCLPQFVSTLFFLLFFYVVYISQVCTDTVLYHKS